MILSQCLEIKRGKLSLAFCPPPSVRMVQPIPSPSPLRKGRGRTGGQSGRRARAAAVG